MSDSISREDAIAQLWENATLSWKLKGKQKDIYDHFTKSEDDIVTCLISRQFGKSFTLCLIAVETCLRTPGAIVKYACPTQKMVERVMKRRVKDIIIDCPEHLKPEWKSQEKTTHPGLCAQAEIGISLPTNSTLCGNTHN